MGMYTGLRCKVIINEEFAPVIETMMNEQLDWLELYDVYQQYPFLKEFGDGFRPNSIPYGSLSYMPDEWETNEEDWKLRTPTDGFERNFDKETRLWSFQCSLKNYEQDIQRFFEIVLPKITDKVIHLEYYYEEWTRSKFCELINGEIVQSDREGNLYGYEEVDHGWGY